MMTYISKSVPTPGKGVRTGGKKLTVPDQSLSLKDILARFIRHEALPIDKGGVYHESEDDLEKLARMDLTEKAEYIDRLKETQARYEAQEKVKEQKRQESIRNEERERIRAEVKAEAEKEANNKP